ncbi:MAG: DUF1549 and DUF1553 domain-containing protein [Pirellulaceae bacterium]
MTRDTESAASDAVDRSEVEFERLLRDAYAVPPVPPALLERLDRAVTEQWGVSPQVARQTPHWLARTAARAGSVWSISLGILLALTLVFMLRDQAYAYSWASVVAALSRQGLMRMGIEGDPGAQATWLALPERQMIYRRSNSEGLVDLSAGVLLEWSQPTAELRRVNLPRRDTGPATDRMVLSFLVGNLEASRNTVPLSDFRLAHESWSRRGDTVDLHVTFRAEQGVELQLGLVVDADTHLPRHCVVRGAGGQIRQGTITYPSLPLDQLLTESVPNLAVRRDAVAPPADSVSSTAPALATTDVSGAVRSEARNNRSAALSESPPLLGAARLDWAPVAPPLRPGSDPDVVAALDALLERQWHVLGITPTDAASDEELLRRVYLDLAGRTPTVTEARIYLADPSPDRYATLVDRLLASPDHATHLATVWRAFLLPEGVDLTRFGGTRAFDEWLAGRFQENVPYDQVVRELLSAEGRLARSGPLLFYAAAKLDADQLAARTARVFLGMRLECAQCHDDPFEPWTQQDFWSYAAFFARISRPQAALESVSTVMQVRDIDRGEVMMPDNTVPVAPRFLDGSEFDERPDALPRRQQLARWLTSANNPFFARAAVNRVWGHLFGRGIVDPIDGFGTQHPARSQELLDLLAGRFVQSGFDLRDSLRTIARSRAYRLSSASTREDAARRDWFAQMNTKMLTAEQVYDCITVASMLDMSDGEQITVDRLQNTSRDQFLQQFRTVAGKATEYQNGIPQALTLMNGSLISDATGLAGSGLLKSLEAPFFTDDQRVEVIYLATLSRRPTAAEWNLLRPYLQAREPGTSIQEPLADVLWAVLNSAEFTMNH